MVLYFNVDTAPPFRVHPLFLIKASEIEPRGVLVSQWVDLRDNSPCGIALRANNSISVESVFHGAKGEAKPVFSEQLAAGSNSDYGLQDSKQKEINLSAWVF